MKWPVVVPALCFLVPLVSHAAGPSFDCAKVEPGSIDETICKDAGLAALDVKMAEVYAAARSKAASEKPPRLEAEQKGWIQGRDACAKEVDKRGCVEEEYTLRTAELQSRYRLVAASGPFFYGCDGNPANEIVATFFSTEPATVIAERGDATSLMFLQQKSATSRYVGRNESLEQLGDEIAVVWGHGSPKMHCKKKANP